MNRRLAEITEGADEAPEGTAPRQQLPRPPRAPQAATAMPAGAAADAGVASETPRPPVVVETVGGDEAEDDAAAPRPRMLRRYKIQEVIKRRQIMLVQVTKEERGNKGAALTTYLSLAGRYCVLMPNTARGGGISRKITSVTDRKRLKSILDELGHSRRHGGHRAHRRQRAQQDRNQARLRISAAACGTKSANSRCNRRAPALIYEEANLIKRAIRDLYARDIDEILVEGDEGYKNAKNFMRMLMPSHAKRVQLFEDPAQHLFQSFQVESQIDAIHNPVVQLRSGGYIVINPTEALVAIDVNSGRSTRERNIEETALRTNLEAADEDRAAAAPARPRRPDRHRLHRHGGARATTPRSSAS